MPVCIAAMLALMYLRAYKNDTIGVIFSFDCIYAPIFIFLACRIISVFPKLMKNFLRLMGKHSMNIWFLHSLFFFRTSELMKYAYAPKFSVLIVAWVIVLCLIVSSALTEVSDFILGKRKQKTVPREKEKILSEKVEFSDV